MEITENDFSQEFLERFKNKEKQYVLDFCNTFLRTFPNVIDKQTLLDRISRIRHINPDRYGALGENVNGETYYEDCSIVYRDGQNERDERNTIYHELFHVLSYKEKVIFSEIGLFKNGVVIDGNNSYYEFINHNPETGKTFDEIMNEYYTIKMLENEGRFLEEEHIIAAPTKTQPKITITDKGRGYTSREFLAEIYHQSFGNDLLKAKILEREDFVSKFNNDFKEMDIKISDNTINRPNFSKIGIQIFENIAGAQLTAINIWKQKMLEKSQEEFNLYEYLKSSHSVMKTLPNVHSRNKTMAGNVNNELISSHEALIYSADEEVIMQQLRPDLVGEQTEPEKIIQKKQFLGVINTLRDNIEGLTREDIGNVSYGEMSPYNHSNLSCLVINAGQKNFMTFTAEEGYRGSSEFSTLSEDQAIEILGENREAECATVPTPRYIWSIVRDAKGYIPLTDNPNMEYVELTDEVYLDGSSVEKTVDSKDGQGLGLRQDQGSGVIDEESVSGVSRETTTFEESLETNSKQTRSKKTNSASFRETLATKRKEHRTGQQDVNKSRNIIALRRERDRLSRGENLSEEQIKRLNEINEILAGQQVQKKSNGMTR